MITLTISVPENEFADILAEAIAKRSLATAGAVPDTITDPAPGNPWDSDWGPPAPASEPPPLPAGPPTAPSPGYAPSAAPQYPPPQSSAPGIPNCAHGPMKFVPGGFSKKSGRPYPAFYACQAPRGAAQCKGRDA